MSVIAYISSNIDPVIFTLWGISVRWYSLLFASGFVASYQILKVYFSNEDVPLVLLDKLTIYIVVATVVGARLGHCLFYDPEYYSRHILEIFLPVSFEPHLEFVGYQGLASHGGALGILIAVILFSRKNKISFFWILDKLSLVVPLAGFLIRIGNFMNSEMIGKPSSVPWAIIFERLDMQPRHPGQLYEAFLYIIIFVLLNLLNHRIHKQPGFIFGAFLILLFSARFVVEFYKENQTDFESGLALNMGQLLSLPFIFVGLALLILKQKNRGPETTKVEINLGTNNSTIPMTETDNIQIKCRRQLQPFLDLLEEQKRVLEAKAWLRKVRRTERSVLNNPDQYLLNIPINEKEVVNAIITGLFAELLDGDNTQDDSKK